MEIYIHKNGGDLGPFTPERIKEGLAHGDFSRSDHAWREGLADWLPLGDVIQSTAPPAPPAPPSSASEASSPTGKGPTHIFVVRGQTVLGPFTATEINDQLKTGVFTAADVAKHSGSETLWPLLAVPGVVLSPSSTAQIPAPERVSIGTQTFAGFWVRLAAYIVDVLVMYVPYLIIHSPLKEALSRVQGDDDVAGQLNVVLSSLTTALLGTCAWWLYSAFTESSAWQGTVGKKLLGLRVTSLAGGRISFGQATARYFSKCVSGIILGIGFLMAAFTERKRALHDMMAGTLVVRIGTSNVADAGQPAVPAVIGGGPTTAVGVKASTAAIPKQTLLQQNIGVALAPEDVHSVDGRLTGRFPVAVIVASLLLVGSLLGVKYWRSFIAAQVSDRISVPDEHEQPSRATAESIRTANESLSRAKQLGLACRLYANDHGGVYPPSLEVLFPEHLRTRQIFVSPFEPDQSMGYKYTPGHTDAMSADMVLLEDRYAVKGGLRVVVYLLDNRGEITLAQSRNNHGPAADAANRTASITTTSQPSRPEDLSSANAAYQKRISDSIGMRWYYYVGQRADLISVGSVKIHFVISESGRVSNVKILSGNANGVLADISVAAITEAEIPPIPPDVADTLDDRQMEVDYDFSQY